LKFGTSKYGAIKYGRYIISKVVGTIFKKSPSKFRIKTKDNTYYAQSTECPLCDTIKVNGVIGKMVIIDGQHRLVRARGNNENIWTITKGVE
jgi:hypothetical protein